MNARLPIDELRDTAPKLPIEIQVDGSVLRCTTMLRHLPGKRLVCLGTLGDREAVAKIYVDPKRARIHAEREARGARAMQERGIRTAPLITATSVDGAHVVAYERIVPAQTAAQVWSSCNQSERVVLFRELVETVAHHHNAGLLQKDLHLGNFIVSDGQIHTLDAAAIAIEHAPIERTGALDNLALLCAQLPPEHDESALAAFDDYARVRGWQASHEDRAALQSAIIRQRERRERLYLQKIFRESSAFVCRKRFTHYYVCDRRDYDADMCEALENPESFFADARFLKRGNTATVAVTRIGERDVVVKRYNLKSPLHALKRAIQPTRAAISWRNAQRLCFYGIATPRPIALVEERIGPLRRTAYFITEFNPGEAASAFFRRNDIADQQKADVAERIAVLIRRLRTLNLSHGDMKATNFLIARNEPSLIDLDAMRKHHDSSSAERALERDLQRFMQNWADDPVLAQLFRTSLLDHYQTFGTDS